EIGNEIMSLAVKGEPNSQAIISVSTNGYSNTVYGRLDGNGNYSTSNLIGLLLCGNRTYTISVRLSDRARNISDVAVTTITTDACPRCGYEGGLLANPLAKEYKVTSDYGPRNGGFHYAIDMVATDGNNWRTPIYAAG